MQKTENGRRAKIGPRKRNNYKTEQESRTRIEQQKRERMDDATVSELKNKVHAVLFSAGRAVDCEELGKLVGAPEPLVREAVRELKKQLEEGQSPLLLTEESNGNAWKLTVRDRYVAVVKDVTPHTELEVPVLATLALIAWKQPMLQSDVIKRRSTVAYEHIAKLEELGFVSKEKKGRSFLLKPTGKFFDYFDLPSQEAVKKLFEEIEPRVQKIQQMSDELTYGAKGGMLTEEKKIVKKGKLGGLDVYEPPEAPPETTPEQKQEDDEGEEETEEGEESEEVGEEKEKKVLDELFGDDEKKGEEAEETEEKEEKTEESEKDEEGEEKEEKDSDEESEEEKQKKQDKGKRKLPKELEDFAGKEEKIGED